MQAAVAHLAAFVTSVSIAFLTPLGSESSPKASPRTYHTNPLDHSQRPAWASSGCGSRALNRVQGPQDEWLRAPLSDGRLVPQPIPETGPLVVSRCCGCPPGWVSSLVDIRAKPQPLCTLPGMTLPETPAGSCLSGQKGFHMNECNSLAPRPVLKSSTLRMQYHYRPGTITEYLSQLLSSHAKRRRRKHLPVPYSGAGT